MDSIWDWLWLGFLSLVVLTYLVAMGSIVLDLVRDDEVSGWVKALWLLLLVLVPLLAALGYLVARGDEMGRRTVRPAR